VAVRPSGLCLTLLLLALLVWSGAGCATPHDESDLPWNMPQSWESAPSLPFGAAGGY